MIERTPVLNAVTHAIMAAGLLLSALPILVVFIASTHDFATVNRVPMPLWPGSSMFENYANVWTKADMGSRLANSMIVAAFSRRSRRSRSCISATGCGWFFSG
jgi:sn-glycerol 3-phosphate transport system permease protein